MRESANDRFLVASGEGNGTARQAACDEAHTEALRALFDLLVRETETRSDVVAAAGGPSRFTRALQAFVSIDGERAQRVREDYDGATDRCFVELRWLLPRQLAAAVRRAALGQVTELEVGLAMDQALRPEGRAPAGLAPRSSAAPTAAAAVSAAYPGWFVRLLPVAACPTHVIAFVGSPGGSESRWLELKQAASGWLVVGDERTANEGWPGTPPAIPSCD